MERTVIDINLNGSPAALDTVKVLDADLLTVFDIGQTRRNAIELKGAIIAPGTFEWHRNMTIGEALVMAQGFLPWARRDAIKVQRTIPQTGQVEVINLNLTGADSSQRFVLEEFDEVVVLDAREMYPSTNVGISGAVHRAMVRPFVEHQTLGDLIDVAGGLREDAQVIEIARRPQSGAVTDTSALIYRFSVSSRQQLDANLRNFTLVRGDQVFVRANPAFRTPATVATTGAFYYPGVYAIASDTETVRSLIVRAGGILPTADPKSLRVVRLGRPVPIEYDRIMSNDRAQNITLYPGDVLQVSQNLDIVTVAGAVERQVAVPWRKGWTVEDYISAAGGYAEKANKNRVVIEYPSGAVARRKTSLRMFRSDPSIEAGATITVGLEPDATGSPWKDTLQAMVQVSSIVVSLTLGYLALKK